MKLSIRVQNSRSRDGSTVVVVMAIIALLLIYSMANLRTLDHLYAELKLLEQRQINRAEMTAQPDRQANPVEQRATGPVAGSTGDDPGDESEVRRPGSLEAETETGHGPE